MKQLPCDRCGTAKLPNGRPNLLGRAPNAFPFRVMCCQCKRPTVLRAADWNRLPELTNAELDAMGELEPLLRDLEGAGHSAAEAADLFRCKWTPVELAGLGSPFKPPESAVAMKVESIVTLSDPVPVQPGTVPELPAQAPEPVIWSEIDPVTGKKTYFIQSHPPLTQAAPPRKPRKRAKITTGPGLLITEPLLIDLRKPDVKGFGFTKVVKTKTLDPAVYGHGTLKRIKRKPKTIKKPKKKPIKPARKVERGRLKG